MPGLFFIKPDGDMEVVRLVLLYGVKLLFLRGVLPEDCLSEIVDSVRRDRRLDRPSKVDDLGE